MVSSKFDSKSYKPWKSVVRPVPKPNAINSAFITRQPPPLPPKPGGKVFVYVYEAPKSSQIEPQINVAGSGTLPPDAQLVVNGLPQGAIDVGHSQLMNLNEFEDNRNAISKLKSRAKKAGKGYKLLADVVSYT